jgi:hypothetical protein
MLPGLQRLSIGVRLDQPEVYNVVKGKRRLAPECTWEDAGMECTCAICLENLELSTAERGTVFKLDLTCEHQFHMRCIAHHVHVNREEVFANRISSIRCPVCNIPMSDIDVISLDQWWRHRADAPSQSLDIVGVDGEIVPILVNMYNIEVAPESLKWEFNRLEAGGEGTKTYTDVVLDVGFYVIGNRSRHIFRNAATAMVSYDDLAVSEAHRVLFTLYTDCFGIATTFCLMHGEKDSPTSEAAGLRLALLHYNSSQISREKGKVLRLVGNVLQIEDREPNRPEEPTATLLAAT